MQEQKENEKREMDEEENDDKEESQSRTRTQEQFKRKKYIRKVFTYLYIVRKLRTGKEEDRKREKPIKRKMLTKWKARIQKNNTN